MSARSEVPLSGPHDGADAQDSSGPPWAEVLLETALADSSVVAGWERLLAQHGDANSLFATPNWCEHLAQTEREQPIRLWCRYDDGGELTGIVPIALAACSLHFDIASKLLWQPELQAGHVLGGVLHSPDAESSLVDLNRQFFRTHPDREALFFRTTPDDSETGRALAGSAELRRSFTVYRSDAARPWFLIDLADSFDEYFGKFSSKTRSTLRRLIRRLEKQGDMVFSRIERPEQVAHFTEAGMKIERHSWQGNLVGNRIVDDDSHRNRLEDLARRGILRGYLLELDGEPLAFVLGQQDTRVFYLADLGFDARYSSLSPGTVLLLLLLQDLMDYRQPQVMNFGIGDAVYKRRFCTRASSDSAWLVLRPGIRRSLLVATHRTFLATVETVKKVIGRGIDESAHTT